MTTLDILKKTRAAWPSIRNRDAEGKNALLRAMADSLMACAPAILAENRRDMEEARGTISDVMLDRLYLDEKRLAGMAEGIRALTALPHPVPDHPAQRHDHLQAAGAYGPYRHYL